MINTLNEENEKYHTINLHKRFEQLFRIVLSDM